jgi:ABC-type Fe3+-hydroxamate transport system substrate-binding protein
MFSLVTAAALAAVGLAGCGSGSDDPAKADARTACDLLDRMGTIDLADKKNIASYELGAAVNLAIGAAQRDGSYRPLRDALQKANDAIQAKFTADNSVTRDNLKKAKDICADL